MEKINKYRITVIILLAIIALFGYCIFFESKQSDELRRLNDQLTERLADATNTCSELAGTVERCKSICNEFESTTSRNIGTVKDAVEIIEEVRLEVQSLELELGIWDIDGYYDWLDNWLKSEGIELNN